MGRRFLVAVGISCSLLLAVGWLTGLRDAMHGALVTLAAVAFFPFLVIAAIFAILVIGAIVAGSGDGPDVGGGEGLLVGFALIPRYYRFLAKQTNAITAGAAAGLALGALVLWAIIAAVIVPGELKTLDAMQGWKKAIEEQRKTSGAYPDTLTEQDRSVAPCSTPSRRACSARTASARSASTASRAKTTSASAAARRSACWPTTSPR